MNPPPEFISIITNTYGEDGEYLIANLPALIDEASQRWSLTGVQPVSNLSYNFVAFASREDQEAILKIGVPRNGLTSEIAALRLFNGEGACQLIEADEEKGFLLLERLKPGLMLFTLEDDEEATHIATEVMKKIWRPVSGLDTSCEKPAGLLDQRGDNSKFILLSDWFDGLKKLQLMFNGGTGPLDERLVARTEQSVKDFLV